jgi:hypothetical protein
VKESDEWITRASAMGSIVFASDGGQKFAATATDDASLAQPTADLDFGILKEGHSWRVAAYFLPSGSRIENATHGPLVVGVQIGDSPAIATRAGDDVPAIGGSARGVSSPSAGSSVLITVKPVAVGAFAETVQLDLVRSSDERQAVTIRAHSIVMSIQDGVPMVKPEVRCLDPV